VTFLLGIPFIGMTTVDVGGRLVVQTRWDWLLAATALAFPLRLGVRCLFERQKTARSGRAAPSNEAPAGFQSWSRQAGTAAIAFALVLPLAFYDNRYVVDVATTVLIYVMLGWGLNVVVGLAGLLDLGYVAFYAVGAYTYALLATQFGLSFWWCLPLAGALAALFGIALGYPTLRLRGDYLAIVTLGFGEIVRLILLNWTDLTHGPDGISSIPRPTLFGLSFAPPGDLPTIAHALGVEYAPWHRTVFLYLLILGLALLTNALVLRLRCLPIGRAWEAIREDEIACKALGINVTKVKLSAFALGALLGGFAGVFFAARQGFISPESFTFSDRTQRRRQDHAFQLPHRLLPSNGRVHHASASGAGFDEARGPAEPRVDPNGSDRAHVSKHPPVFEDDGSREPDRGAAQPAPARKPLFCRGSSRPFRISRSGRRSSGHGSVASSSLRSDQACRCTGGRLGLRSAAACGNCARHGSAPSHSLPR
jgi:branched-chain amino acid transport system permease protein